MAVPPVDAPLVLRAPGSKSDAIRKLLVGSLAPDWTVVRRLPRADDVLALLRCLPLLAEVREGPEDGAVAVRSRTGATDGDELVRLDLGGSATALRLVLAVAALQGRSFEVVGDDGLAARPVGSVVDLLRACGAVVSCADGRLPVQLGGRATRPAAPVVVDARDSSHPLSAALLLGAAFGGIRVVVEGEVASRPYAEWTAQVLRDAGVTVRSAGDEWSVEGSPRALDTSVVGDWSSASYLLAAGACSGRRVAVTGLETRSRQADRRVLDLLRAFGADVVARDGRFEVSGRIENGVDVDLGAAPDVAPLVGALACVADGRTEVRGAAHLRTKETDRIARVVELARRLGCEADERDDGFRIVGPATQAAHLPGHGDHRLVMAFSVAALALPGVTVGDRDAVAKSFPDFHQSLAPLLRT